MKTLLLILSAVVIVGIVVGFAIKAKAYNANVSAAPDRQSAESALPDDIGEDSASPAPDYEENIIQTPYLYVARNGCGDVTVYFNIEADVPLEIGDEMEAIDERAYMNGRGWEGLLNYVMKQRCPELLKTLQTDPEAGTYVAYYPDTEQGAEKAKQLGELIISLIANPEDLFEIVRSHADEVSWDD